MINWTSEFSTGVPEIDADHRRLIEGLNKLEELIAKGQGSQHIGAVLDFLGRYADQHFAREEACMSQHHCPVAAANLAAHAQFRATFAKARARLSKDAGPLIARQVHAELVNWLSQHILKIDTHLRACVKP